MSMVKIKICGLTNFEDAEAALLAGADFLGFIMYPPSPRAVEPEKAGWIISKMRENPTTAPAFTRSNRPLMVGVFVNETPESAAKILEESGLDLAQLSGDEPPEQLTESHSALFGRGYKAIRPKSIGEAEEAFERYLTNYELPDRLTHPRILLDTPHGTLYGGTGERGDWEISALMAKRTPGMMLAGGLTAGNVAEAVSRVRPFAVDVASGIESSPGRKDHDLVQAFITNAKRASLPDGTD
jgi:phosphoribosylanthranilate isomerase